MKKAIIAALIGIATISATPVSIAASAKKYVLDEKCYKIQLARGTAESQARVLCMRPEGYVGN